MKRFPLKFALVFLYPVTLMACCVRVYTHPHTLHPTLEDLKEKAFPALLTLVIKKYFNEHFKFKRKMKCLLMNTL